MHDVLSAPAHSTALGDLPDLLASGRRLLAAADAPGDPVDLLGRDQPARPLPRQLAARTDPSAADPVPSAHVRPGTALGVNRPGSLRGVTQSSLVVAAGRRGASRSGCHRGGVSSSGAPAPMSNRPVTTNRSVIPDAPLAANRRRRTTMGTATTAIEPTNSTKKVMSDTMGSSFAPPGFMGGFTGLSTGQGANRHRVWSILGTDARPLGESFDTPRGEGR
jgi:hypothetical protein